MKLFKTLALLIVILGVNADWNILNYDPVNMNYDPNTGVYTNLNMMEDSGVAGLDALTIGDTWTLQINDMIAGQSELCMGVAPFHEMELMAAYPDDTYHYRQSAQCTYMAGFFYNDNYWENHTYQGDPVYDNAMPNSANIANTSWVFVYNGDSVTITSASRIATIPLEADTNGHVPFVEVLGLVSFQFGNINVTGQIASNTEGGPPPCIDFGNDCFSVEDLQQCFNHLGDLDSEGGNIDTYCSDESDGSIIYYDFFVDYYAGYQHDDCVEHWISFESTDLSEGNGQYDEWHFDSDSQQITFSIKHLDLEDYGCILSASETDFEWQCKMALHIAFAGAEQMVYSFTMKSTLSRIKTDEVTVDVVKNEVAGDCCTNELNIETTLQWCDDMACTNYLSDPHEVERKADVFVEHSITSAEFDYYYLEGKSIKLGPFVPDVKNTDGTQPGKFVYHFVSNVAMGDLELEVISQLNESGPNENLPRRRSRQLGFKSEKAQPEEEEGLRDDYKVKSTSQIKVTDPKEESSKKESEGPSVALIATLAAVGVVLVFGGIGAGVYVIRKRNLAKGDKYREKIASNSSGSEEIKKPQVLNTDAPIQDA